MIVLHPDDVAIEMRHVPTCCCRYVCDPGDTTDVKLIDTRCIAAYHAPDPPDTVKARHAH